MRHLVNAICHPTRKFFCRNLCKSCYEKDYRLKNPEKCYSIAKRKSLKFHYRLTLEEYNEIAERQNNVCLLCERESGGRAKEKRLYVDHDHITGKLRGLICSTCNLGLGYFQDNPSLLRKAANYLDKIELELGGFN